MRRSLLPLAALAAALLAAWGCGVPEPPATTAELAQKAASGDAEAVRRLVKLLGRETGTDPRAEVYRALLEAGPKNAGKAVIDACRDADPVRREHALALAGNMKLEGAFEAARDALADPSFPRSHAAAWALGELGDARAVPLLADALAKGEPPLTAREAARGLERFGPAAVGPLLARLGALPANSRTYALRILGEIRSPEARPALLRALADPATRSDALWALGTMGRVGEDPDLTAYLADPDWRVRVEACRALGLLQTPRADGPLDRLRREDPSIEVREWAARGLGLLRGEHVQYVNRAGAFADPDMLYR